LGEALLAEGQAAQAYEHLARAVIAIEGSLGAQHLELAPGLKALGLAALALGRPGEARVRLERALVRLEGQPEPNADELAETCRGLARALEALGEEPERVHALSERAKALSGPRD
ncbi:MAG: tetratricopeptide repeat protein, partial [Myxococcales bacterium]|nr:tetratricopeptide repeat protein [Myxococcales bacterium]